MYFVDHMLRLSHILLLFLIASPLANADDHGLLNDEEHRWLESLQRPLIIATETGYHPYNFIDEQGELSGVVGDYVRLLQDRLGFDYEVRAYDTFAEVLQAAERRDVDVVPLILAAPERKRYLDFTQPVFETHDHIFTRKEISESLSVQDLVGMRVGMVEGYALQAEMEANLPSIDLSLFPNEKEGLLALSLGGIDAYITEIGVASYYIQQEAITNLRVAGEIEGADPQTFATRSDWPILNRILGKGLASISAAEHTEIQRRWISFEGVAPEELKRLWQQVGTVASLILLILVVMFFWTMSLRRLVSRRTEELQRELAERKLLEADKLRLAVAVEQSAEFVLIVDTSANIEYANLSFREAFGTNPLDGRAFASLAVDGGNDALTDALRIVRETGSWHDHVTLGRDAENAMKVTMTIVPIIDESSEIDGYVVTGRDVTKEEQLESRLRQGERLSALGTLAGGIAHDFNNLLVPILGYADLLRSESSAEAESYVDGIEEAGERARDLVQRIMIFGRGGTGETTPLDLRFEVEDSMSFLRSLLPTTIELRQELNDCGAVMGDRTQLQQILVNLCSNASDAMAGMSGTLTIRLAPRRVTASDTARLPELAPGDYAVLTVSDTGAGMTEETKTKIFDPYFSGRQEAGGTGLGLAIVHGIVAQHGGIIRVQSAPDAGSSFEVFLPTVPAEPLQQPQARGTAVPRGNGETIMLVDDDELVLSTVERMLKGLGYDVSAWSDPLAALDAFTANTGAFDAILADLTMPGLTGVELTERALAKRADIPVAIITGNAAALHAYEGTVIAKPVPQRDLANSMRQLLGRRPVSEPPLQSVASRTNT